MKNILYIKKWFTLIELLVMITIIALLALWISNMSFKKNIDRDRLETLTSNIYNQLESIRNNSLLWKWVWVNLITPEEYRININKTNSWTINTYFLSWSTYSLLDIFETEEQETIKELTCYDIDWTNNNDLDTVDLIYNWENLTLSWCTNDSNRIFELTTKYKGFEKGIIINSVSWLISTTSLK